MAVKKPLRITFIGVVFITVVIFAGLFYRRTSLPVYQGKNAQAWLGEVYTTNFLGAVAAFRAMGPAAYPTIVKGFQRRDNRVTKLYKVIYTKLPKGVRKHLVRPKSAEDHWRESELVCQTLGRPGPEFPELLELLKQKDNPARLNIINAIGFFRPEDKTYVPTLLKFLSESDEALKRFSIIRLMMIGPNASAASPALENIIVSHPSPALHDEALMALRRVDPIAGAKYEYVLQIRQIDSLPKVTQ